jgi:EAL domain-containing protein (putative c-di-GMP-specific phosphodiesterase class I)/ActR/RegA family two-component response regulator
LFTLTAKDVGWATNQQEYRVEPEANAPRRLLVVDDERIQRMIVSRAVESLGFIADAAGTLEEAAARLAERRYDAVVLDLSLGESEGISLLQALRAGASDPLLIFISRLDDRVRTASMRLAAALGLRVVGALEKPVAASALRDLLRSAPIRLLAEDELPDDAPTAEELATGLERGEIFAEFQPKIALADGSVVGMEALARWPRSGAPWIPPATFIPLAEQNGLIVKLTYRIMRQALAACRRWRTCHPSCSVAVNISPLVLADTALPENIDRLLHEAELGPGALIAEITESSVISNPLVAAEVLTRLRIKGVSLSIDDFGTGHSSLLTLLRLPFSELKIDRSFVSNCDSDPEAWKIVRATISMARELGLTVVAEGIETEPAARMLRDMGCDIGQGWYYGRSMPEKALQLWLDARPSTIAA